ncbi:hypothetical protein ISF_08037 [Cordyceps fumosorosea ARSEF 2679]|uniref:Uncharacterized protein n=1 Tax=Cordyceps fumosorosea (strain ARSEF 2679) TaxID=1081104 RepID=A0A167N4D2_CORFA|nr:hypothetical protein ISF_08037 [Cordyceps fumosorosea ARSEF 2679]OAA55116.1 hypothetical protein ISF_08037 [Cordyceps fumosorosea ARSEF 2679]
MPEMSCFCDKANILKAWELIRHCIWWKCPGYKLAWAEAGIVSFCKEAPVFTGPSNCTGWNRTSRKIITQPHESRPTVVD